MHVGPGGISSPYMGGGAGGAKVCPYYPQGKCDKGDGCKWVHSGSPGMAADGVKICPYFPQGKCAQGESCKWLHTDDGSAGQPKACPYFPMGNCEKGDQCKWSHDGASGELGFSS
mmetsp:Transcript_65810/g.173112  ORF Transcript_65810/g.173112 Transcript_65810/m.173112 type:complete len:115 (+) Transcript_65810:3-347(+)